MEVSESNGGRHRVKHAALLRLCQGEEFQVSARVEELEDLPEVGAGSAVGIVDDRTSSKRGQFSFDWTRELNKLVRSFAVGNSAFVDSENLSVLIL